MIVKVVYILWLACRPNPTDCLHVNVCKLFLLALFGSLSSQWPDIANLKLYRFGILLDTGSLVSLYIFHQSQIAVKF